MNNSTSQNSSSTNTSAEIYESFKLMNCVCPKCREQTEVDLSQIKTSSHEIDCTSCGTPLTINRLPYSQREKRTTNNANCSSCGNQLKDLQRCESCGAVFPDFFEAVKSKRKKKGATEYSDRKISPLSIVIITILLAATASLYLTTYMQAREQYIDNYFRVLNAVIAGIDTNIRVSSVKGAAKLSDKDEAVLNRIKSTASRVQKDLANPPMGLGSVEKDKLLAFYGLYQESNSLVTYPPATQNELSELQDLFRKKKETALKDIKASLPQSYIKYLQDAKIKYRSLKDF